MKKIKDRIILGAVCGLIAGAIGRATNAIEFKTGLTDITADQLGSGLFMPKRDAKANTIESKIIASLVNNTIVGVTGVIVTYILSVTGRDKAIIKGVGMGALQWVGIYGLMSRLGLTVKSKKPIAHILSFFDHAVFGATIGLLASKIGDDSLFPDKEVKKSEKLPLVATNLPSNNPEQIGEVNHKGVRRL